jgi:hypothetical protein
MMPTIHIPAASAARLLGATVAMLVLANLAVIYARFGLGYENRGVIGMFDVSSKMNIPAWYSSAALLLAALLLMFIAVVKRSLWERHVFHWGVLAVICLFLSLDEAVSIREKAAEPLRMLFGTGGWFYYGWVIAAGVLALFVLGVFLRFLAALPREIALRFVVAGAIFVGGAIGLEMLGGYWEELHGRQNVTWALLSLIEEACEMAGVVLFIHALLLYIGKYIGAVRVAFAAPREYRGRERVRGGGEVAFGSLSRADGRRPVLLRAQ